MPQAIPKYGNKAVEVPGQMNILIAGKNGGLVDTMILANINPEKHRISLISIPRDLYYNNRKINSIYALYGMEELKRSITFISGYKIDKFILIDMYAFIEVIDLIGGVDVHLDAAVIDPTYKTLDNGVWSTLYYRAGDHHLSGKQALRLARTRHTSSDFARADRQQTILKALQTKAKTFGLGNAETLRKIAGTILQKTETDITLPDALLDYFRYQSFKIEGGNVLSSGNVLESKFTGELKPQAPCKEAATAGEKKESRANSAGESASTTPKTSDTSARKAPECKKTDRGEYILVPKNNNWDVTRWYFHNIIES